MIDHLELQRNILLSSTVDNRWHLEISYSETAFSIFILVWSRKKVYYCFLLNMHCCNCSYLLHKKVWGILMEETRSSFLSLSFAEKNSKVI